MSTDKTTRQYYETIRFARWAIYDALSAASHIASRAADRFEGTDALELFSRVREVIADLRDHSPEMVAVKDAMYAARENLAND